MQCISKLISLKLKIVTIDLSQLYSKKISPYDFMIKLECENTHTGRLLLLHRNIHVAQTHTRYRSVLLQGPS